MPCWTTTKGTAGELPGLPGRGSGLLRGPGGGQLQDLLDRSTRPTTTQHVKGADDRRCSRSSRRSSARRRSSAPTATSASATTRRRTRRTRGPWCTPTATVPAPGTCRSRPTACTSRRQLAAEERSGRPLPPGGRRRRPGPAAAGGARPVGCGRLRDPWTSNTGPRARRLRRRRTTALELLGTSRCTHPQLGARQDWLHERACARRGPYRLARAHRAEHLARRQRRCDSRRNPAAAADHADARGLSARKVPRVGTFGAGESPFPGTTKGPQHGCWGPFGNGCPAASYSPTPSPGQYHRR